MNTPPAHALQRVLRQARPPPLVMWSLVVAVALLSFFVHLLNTQMLRGEQLRQQQRAAASLAPRPAAGGLLLASHVMPAQHPVNALSASAYRQRAAAVVPR